MNSLKNLEVRFNQMYQIRVDPYNTTYEGFSFLLKHDTYHSRLANLTPKKQGYFVAFWKKNKELVNIPYDQNDSFKSLIINVLDHKIKGYFLFPKEVLIEKGIIASINHSGKMGFRVYPSLTDNMNETARKTYLWQSKYFITT